MKQPSENSKNAQQRTLRCGVGRGSSNARSAANSARPWRPCSGARCCHSTSSSAKACGVTSRRAGGGASVHPMHQNRAWLRGARCVAWMVCCADRSTDQCWWCPFESLRWCVFKSNAKNCASFGGKRQNKEKIAERAIYSFITAIPPAEHRSSLPHPETCQTLHTPTSHAARS